MEGGRAEGSARDERKWHIPVWGGYEAAHGLAAVRSGKFVIPPSYFWLAGTVLYHPSSVPSHLS